MHGGAGGSPFDDGDIAHDNIASIHIRCGRMIDAIGIAYRGESQPKRMHGGTGGREEVFNLDDGEYITRVEGRAGGAVDGLRFFTNKGRSSMWYGDNGGAAFVSTEDGKVLKYVSGRSGGGLDAICFHWEEAKFEAEDFVRDAWIGGPGGVVFDDSTAAVQAGSFKITSVDVRSGARVDAIRVNYANKSDNPMHGGSGGNLSTFHLDDDEFIVRIDGRAGDEIDRLQFVTSKSKLLSMFSPCSDFGNCADKTSPIYGGDGGNPFSVSNNGNPLKFLEGRSGAMLDSIRPCWYKQRVSSYELNDVEYVINQASFLNANISSAGSVVLANQSSVDQEVTERFTYSYTEESTWSNSTEYSAGVTVGVTGKIPFIGESKVELSASVTRSFQFGETKSTSKTQETSVTVKVPANSSITANFLVKKQQLDVPYSATMITHFMSGAKSESHIQGVYSGVNFVELEVTYGKAVPLS